MMFPPRVGVDIVRPRCAAGAACRHLRRDENLTPGQERTGAITDVRITQLVTGSATSNPRSHYDTMSNQRETSPEARRSPPVLRPVGRTRECSPATCRPPRPTRARDWAACDDRVADPHAEHKRTDFFALKDFALDVGTTLSDLITCYQYAIAVFDLDGFRIDTVKHIALEDVRNFCGAIGEFADSLGKRHFLLVGEVADGAGLPGQPRRARSATSARPWTSPTPAPAWPRSPRGWHPASATSAASTPSATASAPTVRTAPATCRSSTTTTTCSAPNNGSPQTSATAPPSNTTRCASVSRSSCSPSASRASTTAPSRRSPGRRTPSSAG